MLFIFRRGIITFLGTKPHLKMLGFLLKCCLFMKYNFETVIYYKI